jgi:hypothetical protein
VASGVGERVGVPVVASDPVHSAYRVHGPPFFVLVDGPGCRVVTEGVAWGASQVADHVRQAHANVGSSPGSPVERPSEH